jgi:Mg-chelatase subunit ChlD
VIAVDGSGSIHAEGFKLLKNFTGEMLKRYKSEYHSETTMQVALVVFGNGVIENDGSISKAVLLRELSTDLAATREAAAAMEHQKGFTNMAQAFVLARKLLTQRGRKEAQSAVMTISDGKPSFLFETTEQAKTLESKGIHQRHSALHGWHCGISWE